MYLLSGIAAMGQNNESILKSVSQIGDAVVEYSMTATNDKGRTIMKQAGVVEIRNTSYKVSSEDMQIYCNGVDRWLFSPKTEELVIMNNDMSSDNPMDNPLVFLSSSKVKKNSDGTSAITYKGSDSVTFVITILKIGKSIAEWPADYFTFDTDSIGDNVIVTDLR